MTDESLGLRPRDSTSAPAILITNAQREFCEAKSDGLNREREELFEFRQLLQFAVQRITLGFCLTQEFLQPTEQVSIRPVLSVSAKIFSSFDYLILRRRHQKMFSVLPGIE